MKKRIGLLVLTVFIMSTTTQVFGEGAPMNLQLPKLWNSIFVSILSELSPDKAVSVTVYQSGEKLLIGRSIEGVEQKWFVVEGGRPRLTVINSSLVKEVKTDSGVVVIYDNNSYKAIDGFGRFPSAPLRDIAQ